LASCRTPGPVGAVLPDALSAGTLARRVPTLPGPVDPFTSSARQHGRVPHGMARVSSSAGRWIDVGLAGPDGDGSAADPSRGLVRIVRADESAAGYRRLRFESHEAAREAAMSLAEHPAASAQLLDLGGPGGNRHCTWITEQLLTGQLKVLWRKRTSLAIAAPPAAAPPPAPRRTPAPAAPSSPTPEYSTFPPGLDALAVAQVLKDAAQDGVPFCEECMKAKAAQDSAPAGAE